MIFKYTLVKRISVFLLLIYSVAPYAMSQTAPVHYVGAPVSTETFKISEPAAVPDATPEGIRGFWMECSTLEAAKKWAPLTKEFRRNAAGFCLMGNGKPLSYERLVKMKTRPLTAGMNWKDMKVGGVRHAVYAAYRNLADPTSVVYAVRLLKRVE